MLRRNPLLLVAGAPRLQVHVMVVEGGPVCSVYQYSGLRNGTEPLNRTTRIRADAVGGLIDSACAPHHSVAVLHGFAALRKPARGRLAASRWFTIRSRRCALESSPPNASPRWRIRLSSPRRPARRKISAPPLVLGMETSFRPRVTCSICSSRRMWCRPGSAGHRSCCGPRVFTAPGRPRAATKPPSSKPFERRCARRNGSGWRPTVIARVS